MRNLFALVVLLSLSSPAIAQNCTTGQRCGNSCISREDTCRVDDGASSSSSGGGGSGNPLFGFMVLAMVIVAPFVFAAVMLALAALSFGMVMWLNRQQQEERALTEPTRPAWEPPRPAPKTSHRVKVHEMEAPEVTVPTDYDARVYNHVRSALYVEGFHVGEVDDDAIITPWQQVSIDDVRHEIQLTVRVNSLRVEGACRFKKYGAWQVCDGDAGARVTTAIAHRVQNDVNRRLDGGERIIIEE